MLFLAVRGFPIVSHRAVLEIVVCVSALLVVAQAISASKHFLAAGFSTIAVLFNPLVPLPITRNAFVLLEGVLSRGVSRLTSRIEDTTDTLCTVNNQPGTEK